MHALELRALKINQKARGGLTVSAVMLVPAGKALTVMSATAPSHSRAKAPRGLLE